MTLKRAIVIVVLSGIIFSGIGGAIGWMLGVYSPEYYRTVFYGGDDPDFDPVQMGRSLGLMQGLVAGIVIAAVVIGLLIWRDSFKARLDEDPDVGYVSAARSRAGFWIVIWCLTLVLSVAFFSTAAFVIGNIVGRTQAAQGEMYQQLQKLDDILKDGNYPDVRSESYPDYSVYLEGTVKDQATLDQLRHDLVLGFGTMAADGIIERVKVKPQE